jgi:hypothetical protein
LFLAFCHFAIKHRRMGKWFHLELPRQGEFSFGLQFFKKICAKSYDCSELVVIEAQGPTTLGTINSAEQSALVVARVYWQSSPVPSIKFMPMNIYLIVK